MKGQRDGKGQSEGTDDVAALIRLAGRRPGVPPERSARVKASLLEEWMGQVQRRRRRRRVWTAAVVAAAASLALALVFIGQRPSSDAGPVQTAATVESLEGSVWIAAGPGGGETAGRRLLRLGDAVASRSLLDSGDDGRLALRFSRGRSLRLDRGTVLHIEDSGDVMLEAGSVYVDSSGRAGQVESLVVRTPLGVVREIGTQYEVRLSDSGLRVRVREGRVTLDDGSQVREVAAADELTLEEDGTAVSRKIPIHGPEWDWIAQVTRVPELDGMSPRAFLEWVARERGWRLRFETEDLARSAGSITLDGSLERLSLDEALDAVLPTCGLSYRMEQDALVIGTMGKIGQTGQPQGPSPGPRQ